MLSLSRKTDYALLILTALAERPTVYTSLRDLTKEKNMPYRFVSQIVQPLLHAGILESREGAGGGYRLAKEPSAITVQDVVAAEEGGVALAACLDPSKHFACQQKEHCTVRRGMPTVQRLVLQTLSKHTLADLISENPQ